MSANWEDYFTARLQELDNAQQRRSLQVRQPAGLLDFGSNDYLGLTSHPRVCAAAFQVAAERVGSGGSPVLSGYQAQHRRLEGELAAWSQTESALVFSSGYACNVGVLPCLAAAGDLILSDRLNHASLIDGCRLSRATKIIYPHRDVEFVADYLSKHRHRYARALLVTESIFSMDGNAAPLSDMVDVAERYDVGSVVDEAHAVGIYGAAGGGLLEELGLQGRVLVKVGTLSKAMGGQGGYVCGSQRLIEYVLNTCRSYLFSTAPLAASMAAATAALAELRMMTAERTQLRQAARELRSRLADSLPVTGEDDCPIVPLIVGSSERVIDLSRALLERGLYVPAIRPPTVPPGTSRLRLSLSIRHSDADVDRLVGELNALL